MNTVPCLFSAPAGGTSKYLVFWPILILLFAAPSQAETPVENRSAYTDSPSFNTSKPAGSAAFCDAPKPYTKVGISLSGGGAKGFAHLGVLKVLEEVGMPIDYISGTSMGALVGGLYSMGYSSEYIEELASSLNWDELFSDRQRRRHIPMEEKEWNELYLLTLPLVDGGVGLPAGVVAGQRIELLLSRLAWPYPGHQSFLDFPIPFTSVATNIETGEAVIMDEGYIAEAIRASISIPSIFSPVEVDGKILIDGGVVRNLPVEECRAMGADYVLGVNVSAPLKDAENLTNIVEILDQTITFQISDNVRHSKEMADWVLQDERIFDISATDFDRAQEIIDIGEDMARQHYDELLRLAQSFRAERAQRELYPFLPGYGGLVYITDITVKNLRGGSSNQIRSKLQLSENTYTSPDDIVNGIENLYGMQFYEKVTYRLVKDESVDYPKAYILELNVVERERGIFGFGFNYSNFNGAAILLNLNYRNLLYPGTLSRLNVRLGEEPYVDTRYFYYLPGESDYTLNLRGNYSLDTIDFFDADGNRTTSFNTHSFFVETAFIPYSSNQSMMGLGLRQEFFHLSRRVGGLDFPGGGSSVSELFTRWHFDNLERAHFPRRGHSFKIELSQSLNLLDTSLNYFRASGMWNGNISLNEQMTFTPAAYIGYASRSELPLHKQFRLGGHPGLVGFREDEISSSKVRMLQAGLRYEIMPNRFISFLTNAASTEELDNFDFKNTPVRLGWGVGAGVRTMIAPMEVVLMSSSRHYFLLQYSIGISF